MNTPPFDLDPFWERLALANSVQLDEVVARHYRADVPVLLGRIHALEVVVDDVDHYTRPRCYVEFCCNEAVLAVVVEDRSDTQDRTAIPWGWCSQHAPK